MYMVTCYSHCDSYQSRLKGEKQVEVNYKGSDVPAEVRAVFAALYRISENENEYMTSRFCTDNHDSKNVECMSCKQVC